MLRKGFFDAVQHQIQTGIPNAVDRHLQPITVGPANEPVKLLRCEHTEADRSRVIGIRTAEIGGTGAKGTVAQHFQRTDAVQRASTSGAVALLYKLLQLGQGGKVGLLVHPYGQLAGCFQFPVGLVDCLP